MKVYALVRSIEKANTIFSDCVGAAELKCVIADLEKDELSDKIQIEGDCDYIIAPIADNRMFPIINSFRMSQALEDNLITHTSNKTVVEEKRLLFYFNPKEQ